MRIPHDLREEFPQETSFIEHLTKISHDFGKLVVRYDEINQNIFRIESEQAPAADDVLEQLKKQRLRLRDGIAAALARLERRM